MQLQRASVVERGVCAPLLLFLRAEAGLLPQHLHNLPRVLQRLGFQAAGSLPVPVPLRVVGWYRVQLAPAFRRGALLMHAFRAVDVRRGERGGGEPAVPDGERCQR